MTTPADDLRGALERLEGDAATADHGSIEDGPAFARGLRYGIEAVRAALATDPQIDAQRVPAAEPGLTGVEKFRESQRYYSAGYDSGRRALVERMEQWLDSGPDQGDHEFGWKAAVRDALHHPRTATEDEA